MGPIPKVGDRLKVVFNGGSEFTEKLLGQIVMVKEILNKNNVYVTDDDRTSGRYLVPGEYVILRKPMIFLSED